MYRLLETIKIRDGEMIHRTYHESRMNRSRHELLAIADTIDLTQVAIPKILNNNQVYKCRIVYSREIEDVRYTEYHPRKIRSLQIIRDDQIEYSCKYLERSYFEELKSKAPGSDEIIIVKNGWVTDTTYSNLVFYDGKQWLTPSTPLLKGTKRAYYLDIGKIREAPIRENDIFDFQKVCLINAMLDIEDGVCVNTQKIINP